MLKSEFFTSRCNLTVFVFFFDVSAVKFGTFPDTVKHWLRHVSRRRRDEEIDVPDD